MASLQDQQDSSTPATNPEVTQLWNLAFVEIKRLARARMRDSGRHTLLDTTGLVNEAYLRMSGRPGLALLSRGEFFSYCARVMRSVVVDLVREKQAQRRGGDQQKVTLNTALLEAQLAAEDEPLWVHEALEELSALEPRLAQVVEMRYFAGFSETEIAQMLGVTDRTVRRDWEKARVLLHSMLGA